MSTYSQLAIILNLTPAQHQYLEQAATRLATLQGRSVGKDVVILKLMEFGLPLFQAELEKASAALQSKNFSKTKSARSSMLRIVR